jgi:hypothetical protein
MLALRNILCSDRWKEEWPKIEIRLRQQTAQRRNQRHQARIEQKAALTPVTLPKIDALPRLLQPKPPDTPKTPKENPWKKFKYGRSLFQPKNPPKN